MFWDDFRKAFEEANRTLEQADSVATTMAKILRGRLRKVDPWIVAELKRELQDFNSVKRKWKERK